MLEAFKLVTGVAISDCRRRIRMEEALHQLQVGKATVTEAAYNAGYEYPSNFATAFKCTFGFSPKLARFRTVA